MDFNDLIGVLYSLISGAIFAAFLWPIFFGKGSDKKK